MTPNPLARKNFLIFAAFIIFACSAFPLTDAARGESHQISSSYSYSQEELFEEATVWVNAAPLHLLESANHAPDIMQASAALLLPATFFTPTWQALSSQTQITLILIASALLSATVLKSSQWGVFDGLPSLDQHLRKARDEASAVARKAAGTIEGQVREIIEASNRSVHSTLDHLKQQAQAVEGGTYEHLERMLDDIHAQILKDLSDGVHLGKNGVDHSVEAMRELWNKAVYERLSALDQYLEKILDDILGSEEESGESHPIAVPRELRKQHHLRKLGLPADASWQEIAQRFKQVAKENHPDLAGADPQKIQRFIKAQKAYASLKEIHRQEIGKTKSHGES